MYKHGLPIIPCSPKFASRPVNCGRQVDRLTGERVLITYNPGLSYFCPGLVNPGRQVDRLAGGQETC